MLDTARRIATPEGIELALRLAGPVPRAGAWALDLLLRLAILAFLAMILGLLGGFGLGLFLLCGFFLEWLFPAWCEVNWGGATPGKKALGLVVLHDDGTPVRWPAALARNLLRAIDFLPAFYGFGLAPLLANPAFKRPRDLLPPGLFGLGARRDARDPRLQAPRRSRGRDDRRVPRGQAARLPDPARPGPRPAGRADARRAARDPRLRRARPGPHPGARRGAGDDPARAHRAPRRAGRGRAAGADRELSRRAEVNATGGLRGALRRRLGTVRDLARPRREGPPPLGRRGAGRCASRHRDPAGVPARLPAPRARPRPPIQPRARRSPEPARAAGASPPLRRAPAARARARPRVPAGRLPAAGARGRGPRRGGGGALLRPPGGASRRPPLASAAPLLPPRAGEPPEG